MKKMTLLFVAIASNIAILFADGTAGDDYTFETRYGVDMATAGILPEGYIGSHLYMMDEGSVAFEVNYAPIKNLMLGAAFGGRRIIGNESVALQRFPGIQIRYRVHDETLYIPAIALGINTQGRDKYNASAKRFGILSQGVYVAMSKNFLWDLGNLATHGGVNYSFEPNSDDRSPSFYLALEQSLGKRFAINLEYNSQLDESATSEFMHKRGLLHLAMRASLGYGLTAELQFRDLTRHQRGAAGFTRFLALEYVVKI